MKLSVPTNWDDGLVSLLEPGPIRHVYGKLQEDFVGGGRASFLLPPVSKKKAESHIKALRDHGIGFNYLLNSLHMDNEEFSKGGMRNIRKLLDWLARIKVSSLTVAVPFLALFVKKDYPQFDITISSLMHIDSIEKVRYWDACGMDEVVLWDTECNRNFKLLREIRANAKIKIQLIANNACLYQCPFRTAHYLYTCHLSRKGHARKSMAPDFYHLTCQSYRLNDPVEIVKSQWIRPEDLHYYEKLGIDTIKLVDRRLPTAALMPIVNAYLRRNYRGNLLDLFPNVVNTSSRMKIKPSLGRLYDLSIPLFLDNAKLDGFLDYFVSDRCTGECARCMHCKEYGNKAISSRAEEVKDAVERYSYHLRHPFFSPLRRNPRGFSPGMNAE